MQYGERVIEGSRLYPEYKDALKKFPDLEACKEAGFLSTDLPFLKLHKVFSSKIENEVCHFWYFSESKNPTILVITYLQNIENVEYSLYKVKSRFVNKNIHSISWNIKKYSVPYGGYISRKLTKSFAYSAGLSVTVTDKNEIYRIHFSSSIN